MKENIEVRGARTNNLNNVSVTIPRDKLVVMTGLSGSGKSSLAFDTIYAEGQRRYVESLSSYARQFLGQMDKPDVDYIEGLSPAISIDQKTTSRNPRSTVGTVTEIYDYLRLLWARVGIPHCPNCGKEIKKQTIDQIVDQVMAYPERTKIQILSPIIRAKKGEHAKIFEDARRSGYVRVRVDGIIYDLSEDIKLEKNKKHNVEVVVDRLVIKPDIIRRLTDSIETATSLSDNLVIINILEEDRDVLYSQNFACEDCGISVEELAPRSFSFNNPFGACPKCHFRLDEPFRGLSKEVRDIIFYGTGEENLELRFDGRRGTGVLHQPFEGIVNNMERRYRESTSESVRSDIEDCMSPIPCTECGGRRLKKEILAVTVGDLNISQFCDYSVNDALDFMNNLSLSERDQIIAKQILKEITSRLQFLSSVGLGYLNLSRAAGTLSGGESQRIRLATQIGSSLMGVLYILDEPSIGLHQRDNAKLLATLKQLRDLGNSLIVVEHDEETMREADYIVDIGPGAGIHGGNIVATGTVDDICKCKESVTGQYLSGEKYVPVPSERRSGNGNSLRIIGAQENNLKNIDVEFPLGTFICVTGVSGSGKSSLVNEILYKTLGAKKNHMKLRPGKYERMEGLEHVDKVIAIDQSPIGRSPRSNPATYTGVFNDIRELFANSNDAKLRGYDAGRFSFNVKGGRCEACSGDGLVKIEMNFLSDVYVPCEVCGGKRYNRETLEVRYKGKNIADVLDMTVEEALSFFENHTKIRNRLQVIYDVGLGYIKLGQSSTTLSGGEAQRIKLATELSKKSTGSTVYILDEPTTGLHAADVHRLINILDRLADAGNTVIVIEHNLDVIKTADSIIDLGPEGGDGGGELVFAGTPEDCARCDSSFTGQFLKRIL